MEPEEEGELRRSDSLFRIVHVRGAIPKRRRGRRRRSLARVVHARGAIPNEMGSAQAEQNLERARRFP